MKIFFKFVIMLVTSSIACIPASSRETIFAENDDIVELITCIESNNFDLADKLIEGGLSLETRGEHGETVLSWFVKENNVEAVRYLYAKGASPMVQIENDSNVLERSAANCDSTLLKLALANGGNPNLISEFWRQTPIFTAIISKNIANLKMLLDNGAYTDIANPIGVTPLLLACDTNFFEGAVVLLNAGANPELKDRFGHSVKNSLRDSMITDCDQGFESYQQVKSIIGLE